MSEFAAERELRAERMNADATRVAKLEMLGRGERLSVEDRTALDAANKRIGEIDGELRTIDEARALSAAASAGDAPVSASAETRERSFTDYLKRGVVAPELRAAGEATNSAGGYLVPPGWWQRLQVALKAFGGIASDFEQLETESGQPMTWATVDPTTIVGQLVGGQTNPPALVANTTGVNENSQIEDVDYTFGNGQLSAYMYTSGVQKVSIQLANDSAFDIDQFVQARVGESLGRGKALAAVSGSGTSAPLGIIPALSTWTGKTSGGPIVLATGGGSGVPQTAGGSDKEIATNTLAPITLRKMIAQVDPAYRALGAKFYMNDAQLLGLRGQVDSNGRPLINLSDGLTPGAPSGLWGYEIVVDQNIPNLSATFNTVGGPVFGHLASAMVLRTVTQSGLMRLSERYADLAQIGFIGYMRFDIKSNDLRAASTVQTGAS